MKLPRKQTWPLSVQKVIAFICMPLLYFLVVLWMKYIKNYRINELRQTRRQFKKIVQQNPSGLLICPNHLTYIDSLLLAWSFSSMGSYLMNFRTFCWNLPNARNVQESVLYRIICYLGKCILISEDPEQAKQTMKKAAYLLHHGQYVMIFPEGHRSTNGRVDTENFIYGVGKLHMDSHLTQVLCVYLRGDHQKLASKMPPRGERFNIKLKLQTINNEQQGRRAMRAAAKQIIDSIAQMESDYFQNQTSEAA